MMSTFLLFCFKHIDTKCGAFWNSIKLNEIRLQLQVLYVQKVVSQPKILNRTILSNLVKKRCKPNFLMQIYKNIFSEGSLLPGHTVFDWRTRISGLILVIICGTCSFRLTGPAWALSPPHKSARWVCRNAVSVFYLFLSRSLADFLFISQNIFLTGSSLFIWPAQRDPTQRHTNQWGQYAKMQYQFFFSISLSPAFTRWFSLYLSKYVLTGFYLHISCPAQRGPFNAT